MPQSKLGLILVLGLLGPAPSAAQTAAERLPTCLACHGQTGTSAQENTPSLGAMPPDYLLTQLYLFREKLRSNEIMNAMAAGLGDDDIRDLSEVVAKLPAPTPAEPLPAADRDRGQALVERYHCNSCHGADLGGQRTIPRIAAQRADYLEHALTGYKTNTRRGYSPAMNEASQDLDPADIPLLAKYVAQLH